MKTVEITADLVEQWFTEGFSWSRKSLKVLKGIPKGFKLIDARFNPYTRTVTLSFSEETVEKVNMVIQETREEEKETD